jgi:spore coat protein U-like protein
LVIAGEASAQICGLNVNPIVFGHYNPFLSVPLNATGAINIICHSGVRYAVKLSAGQKPEGGFSQRRMRHALRSYTLAYNVYSNPALTEIWGDGTAGTSIVSGIGKGTMDHWIVYGRLSGGQNVGEGSYSDTITVTAEW